MERQQTHSKKEMLYEKAVERRFANYKVILSLVLTAVTLLFISLSFLYVFSRSYAKDGHIKLPVIFLYNTIPLALSSIMLLMANRAFKKDDVNAFKATLLLSGLFGTLFIVFQVWGVILMQQSGFDLIRNNAASYLWVISLFHGLHLLAGIGFWMYFTINAYKGLSSFALSPFYFSEPAHQIQLRLLSIYWHFIGVVWLYLLTFFIVLR